MHGWLEAFRLFSVLAVIRIYDCIFFFTFFVTEKRSPGKDATIFVEDYEGNYAALAADLLRLIENEEDYRERFAWQRRGIHKTVHISHHHRLSLIQRWCANYFIPIA